MPSALGLSFTIDNGHDLGGTISCLSFSKKREKNTFQAQVVQIICLFKDILHEESQLEKHLFLLHHLLQWRGVFTKALVFRLQSWPSNMEKFDKLFKGKRTPGCQQLLHTLMHDPGSHQQQLVELADEPDIAQAPSLLLLLQQP